MQKPTKNLKPDEIRNPKSEPSLITWSPWITAVLVIASYLVANVIGQILIAIYVSLRHMTAAQAQVWLNSSTSVQFIFTLLVYTMLLLPLLWFVRLRKVPISTFGLKRPRLRDPLFGLALLIPYYLSYFVLVIVVHALVPSLDTGQQQQIGFSGAHGAWPLILTFVSLCVIPPLVEEMVVRGFVYTSFRAKLKLSVAVILTSLIFAAGHLQPDSGAPLLWIAAIDTFTLSLFLIYLRQKTSSLWASITLHAAKNSVAFLYLFILHRG